MSKSVAAVLTASALLVGGSVVSNISEPEVVQQEANVVQIPEPNRPTPTVPIKKTEPVPKKAEPRCHTSYSGCLKPDSGDYDCAGGTGNGPNYTGLVEVLGPDVFDLDRDNDGWGCE
jgi:hypothetical protein